MSTSLFACGLSLLIGMLESPNSAQDEAQIRKAVLDSQRAGFIAHNHKKYMSLWTEDARIVMARGPLPGQYDCVYPRRQIDQTRRLRFRAKSSAFRNMRYENEVVKIEGSRAIYELTVRSELAIGFQWVREVYRLRKTDAGWKAYENRFWPLKTKYDGETTLYDEKEWKRRDLKVEDALKQADLRKAAFALADAWRPRAAHLLFRRITLKDRPSAMDWVNRGHMALWAGHARDARRSFLKAKSMDSKIKLPPFMAGQFVD